VRSQGLACVYWLKAARHRAQCGNSVYEDFEGNSAGMSGRKRAKQVEHVHLSRQAGAKRRRASWSNKCELCTCGSETNIFCPPICLEADAIGHDLRLGMSRGLC
jgi:hypothetical protein